MIKIPGTIRTYQISIDDFPIRIETKAINLPFCRAVASDVVVMQNETPLDPIPVTVMNDPGNLSISWEISLPGYSPELDLLEKIDCWFPDNPPDSAKYQVTITSKKGDIEKTNGSQPSVNPRTINLTFYYR